MASKKERVNQAKDLYERFTGHEADSCEVIKMPRVDVAMLVGEVEVIAYNTIRDGKKQRYMHTFDKNARPRLAASHDGKTLLIIEGNFEFTDRGITDNE